MGAIVKWGWRSALLPVVALGGAALMPPARGFAQADAWRPRTIPLLGVSYAPDVGLAIGAGLAHTRYGFRALPPSTRVRGFAEYATGAHSYRAALDGEFRGLIAPRIFTVELLASGLEIIRFYGFGNASDASQADAAYRVRQQRFLGEPTVSWPLAPRVRLSLGPFIMYTHTRPDSGTLLASGAPPYGAGDFRRLGARVMLELDTRDAPTAPARGVLFRLATRGSPAAWDVVAPFGAVSAEASTYLSPDDPAAILALRVGGAHVSGGAPFDEAVYIGGGATLRGYAEQRFAGRSGAYANAELRLRAAFLPIGELGVLGLGDVGRVWLPGEGSDRWHAAAGGGLWFAPRHNRANLLSLTVAKSPERTAIYLRAGFMF